MADKEAAQNPLLAARPPATDYLTYLTIIEYNLTEENLPVLHHVLQDTELTANIGWDLVHLLLPLLPASEECLNDIAVKGNPREVILKVTEALRLLELQEPEKDSDDEDEPTAEESSSKTQPVEIGESSTSPALPATAPPPLYVLKFEVLLSLLSILHRRVKAKYPSRFLATSLQAVLAAYGSAKHHMDDLTLSALKFVKTLSGTKRPQLPPRASSGNLLKTTSGRSEPDPEAQTEPPTADEETLVTRLLQSFITHVLEDYMLTLSSEHDVPGLAWSSRLMEKFEPKRIVPNKPTYSNRFSQEEGLHSRSDILGQTVALAQDLGLSTQELLKTVLDPEKETPGIPGEEDEPPSSAEDIPLSKTGSLFMFAARNVKQELFASAGPDTGSKISIFSDHATIIANFVGTAGPSTIGLESEALLDAVLCLGLLALEKNNIGEPSDDEAFAKYLQTMSLISANTASPTLRYHAHYLTSTVLRSHPSDLIRLTFIRDTLEHCPYENLKASAVGWLKGETLEANIPQRSSKAAPSFSENETSNIFATPVALSTTAPFLFPDLTSSWTSTVEISESFMQFRAELGFYLAALNFYYLLLTAKMVHENLDIKGLHSQSGVEKHYLAPLRQAIGRFREALEEGGELAISEGEEGIQSAKTDLMILEDVLDRVEKGIEGLGVGGA
ncbi:YAP-binding/ALF4/Glomulin [Clohesyomyces aquaticus]|uniref:YAP-binding/ALF4/Glomulin n=1 Tax=Clohesyomyces aquaticus TaxID=1231657 RepID=A0A1Y1ZIA1_9PLEO|nr:YAP-binding/ALF4/Glomulin [Clohesyomyces aquaticus]